MDDDFEQLRKVQTQLNSAISVALRNRQKLLKKLTDEDKTLVLKFEKDYRKLMTAGDDIEANALHHKFLEKYSK